MSSEELDTIRSSYQKLGMLSPIILDAHGNRIDGEHRLEIDPKWKKFSVKLDHIKTKTQLILARFSINNDRRIVSAEEKTELLRQLIQENPSWNVKKCADELGKAVSTLYPYFPDELKDKKMQSLKKGKDSLFHIITDKKERDVTYSRVCKEFEVSEGELSANQVGRYLRMKAVDQRRLKDSFKAHRDNGNESKSKNLFNRLEKKLGIIVLKDRRVVPQTAQEGVEVHQGSAHTLNPLPHRLNSFPNVVPQVGLEVKPLPLLNRDGVLRSGTEFTESYNPSLSFPSGNCRCKGCEIGKNGACLALTLFRERMRKEMSK